MQKPVALPRDGNGVAVQTVPAVLPRKRTYNASLSTSVDIALQPKTTYVEVTAIAKPVLLKWSSGGAVAASAATDGFDEVVQAGVSKGFYVPIDITTKIYFTDLNIIEQAASATVIVIEK